jgi:aminoglycoside phosphotransferase (APT) family kinase protein
MERLVVARPGVRVFRGWHQGIPVAIKRFDDERHFRREALVASALSRNGAPIPRVIDQGFRAGAWTLTTAWVEGRSGSEVAAAETALDRRLAQTLALVHQIGRSLDLDGLASGILPGAATWEAELVRQLAKWRSRLRPASYERLGGVSTLDRACERIRRIAAAAGVRSVVHCDIALRNIIVGQSLTSAPLRAGGGCGCGPRRKGGCRRRRRQGRGRPG